MHKLVIAESQDKKRHSLAINPIFLGNSFFFVDVEEWMIRKIENWSIELSFELAGEIAFWVVGFFFSVSPTTLLSLRAFGESRFSIHVAQILVVPPFIFHSGMIWLPCNLNGFRGKLLILIRIIHILVSNSSSFSGRLIGFYH